MARDLRILDRHLRVLSVGYRLRIAEDFSWINVLDFKLPPGFNCYETQILVEIPRDYPLSPPGVSKRVYLPPDLRFDGRKLADLHENTTPGWGNWAWFCYEWIRWNPLRDDLVKFMEMIRADLTKPKTK